MATAKQRKAAEKRARSQGISYNQALADVTANSALISEYLTSSEIASYESTSYDSGSSSSYDSSSSSSYDSGSSSY